MDNLEKYVSDASAEEFLASSGLHRTKYSINMSILRRVAQILDIDLENLPSSEKYVYLSKDIVKALDDEWYKIDISSDCNLSSQDRRVRQRFESEDPHFESTTLYKYLSILFKKNSILGRGNLKSERILKDRKLNVLLAVDGFSGFFPSSFKYYIDNLVVKDRCKQHVEGVKNVYGAICEQLNGTDSACIVFLTLCKVYLKENQLDDRSHLMLDRAVRDVYSFLQKSAQYYKELENILKYPDSYLDMMGKVYVAAFHEEKTNLKRIALDKLAQITCKNQPFWKSNSIAK